LKTPSKKKKRGEVTPSGNFGHRQKRASRRGEKKSVDRREPYLLLEDLNPKKEKDVSPQRPSIRKKEKLSYRLKEKKVTPKKKENSFCLTKVSTKKRSPVTIKKE